MGYLSGIAIWEAYLNFMEKSSKMIWLVVSTYPSEKYEFVNWEDEIPN